MVIEFDDKTVVYEKQDLANIDLAYCLSVHKAQGSEADNVILLLSNQHFFMLNRELVYTAVTRAKKRIMIVGDPNLIAYASKKIASKRQTTLIEKIK